MAVSQSFVSFRVIPDLLQGATSRPTPARPGRTNRTVRSTFSRRASIRRSSAPSAGCGAGVGSRSGPRERMGVEADCLREVVRGLARICRDAGEGVTAGKLGTPEPGALVAEDQRDRSRAPGRLGCERLGVERTPPPPSCSRRPPPRACPRAAPRRARPRRRRPASGPARSSGLHGGRTHVHSLCPKFLSAGAAAPRFSGVRGWTRTKRTGVGMGGRTLAPSRIERRQHGSLSPDSPGSCSVRPVAARGAASRGPGRG